MNDYHLHMWVFRLTLTVFFRIKQNNSWIIRYRRESILITLLFFLNMLTEFIFTYSFTFTKIFQITINPTGLYP
jgi:hypothetical protein